MAKIKHVELTVFAYKTQGVSMDGGGFDTVYVPGKQLEWTKYAIRITDADGATGSYVALWGGTPMAFAQTRLLASRLPGRDANHREQIFDDFKRALRQYDHMGHGAVDIALWDLLGQKTGLSVSELLGGYRKRLPAYASSMHGDRNGGLSSPADYVAFAEHCFDLGYRAFKAHGWCEGNLSEERALVLALGREVGDRLTLMLDPACQIRTLSDAIQLGRACDEAGFLWYEDPFRDTGVSLHAHRMLREAIRTPILATEHVRGIEPKADFAIGGGTDFLRADPEYDLGITGCMKIAHLAEALGMDVEIHACGPAHRHCMSAIRNSNYYEVALVGPKAANPLPPVYTCGYSDNLDCIGKDGCVEVPEGPGLGVDYDWEYIRRNAVETHSFVAD